MSPITANESFLFNKSWTKTRVGLWKYFFMCAILSALDLSECEKGLQIVIGDYFLHSKKQEYWKNLDWPDQLNDPSFALHFLHDSWKVKMKTERYLFL